MVTPEEPQCCETLQDVRSRSGQRVILKGTYHQVDVRMRRKPPAAYAGHAAIRLQDETDVLLEPSWSPDAIRTPEEHARYEAKRVQVTGVVHSEAPKPAEPLAYITGPCLSPVEEIRMDAQESY
jgi:hypothetical protein